jgi:hypothetical protein
LVLRVAFFTATGFVGSMPLARRRVGDRRKRKRRVSAPRRHGLAVGIAKPSAH